MQERQDFYQCPVCHGMVSSDENFCTCDEEPPEDDGHGDFLHNQMRDERLAELYFDEE